MHGRELVRGQESGTGRTDAISTGLRYPKPPADSDDAQTGAETVCLQVSNSFSAPPAVKTAPGLPVELNIAVVDAPDKASDVASFGLGRGWWLLGVLALTGLVSGVLWGWISRLRFAGRTN